MADWTPPASDAVAAPTFVPPASDRVKKPEEENLPVVQHYADLAKLKPGTDYIDSAGARKTFTDQDSQDFAAKNFKGPGAGMLAGLPVSGSIPGSKAAKSILLQGGFGTAGAIAGSVFPGAGTIAGGAGGAALGNILDQETDPEYDANKPGLGIKKGQVLAAGLTGAIAPGSPVGTGLGGLAKAALREGVKQGTAGVAGKTIETEIDEGRAPTGKELILAGAIPAIAGGASEGLQAIAPKIQAALVAKGSLVKNKQDILAKWLAEDGVIQPSMTNKTLAGNALEGAGGAQDLARDVSARNQAVVNKISRREAGLEADTPINEANLEDARERIAQPYRELGSLSDNGGVTLFHDGTSTRGQKYFTANKAEVVPPSVTSAPTAQIKVENPAVFAERPPQADIDAAFANGHDAIIIGDKNSPSAIITSSAKSPNIILSGSDLANASKNLEAYRQAKADATRYYQSNNGKPDPDALAKAHALDEKADSLLTSLDQAAMDAKRPDLVPKLQQAKIDLAKNHDVERALNIGSEDVDARVFGRELNKNGINSKTDGLRLIGQIQKTYPDALKPVTKSSGVNKLSLMLGGLAGVGTQAATHNTESAALAALAPVVLPALARKAVLSGPYQKFMARVPGPKVNIDPTDVTELIQQMSQAAGQKIDTKK